GDGFFEVLVGAIGDGVVLLDDQFCIRWASGGLESLLGYRLDDVRGLPIYELLHPDDLALAQARRTDPTWDEWQSWQTTRRVRDASGHYVQFDCSVSVHTDDPRIDGIVVVLRRASDRFQTWETERRLRAMVENAAEAVVVYGPDLSVLYASPSALPIFDDDLSGTLRDHMERFVPASLRKLTDELYARLLHGRNGPIHVEFPVRDSHRWIEARATNLLDDPAVGGIILNVRDVTAQALLQQRLEEAARRDPLTGLPNRTRVLELLEEALTQPDGGTVAVLFLDLDRFKVVNDSLGHATGDRVLVELGKRLEVAVEGRGTVGRFGGDEYVVVTVVEHEEEAIELAEMLGQVAREPFTVVGPEHDQVEVFLSTSVGIALAAPGDEPDALLHHADAAMYRSKAKARQTWELYDEAMRDEARSRLQLETDLIRALDIGAFELHYQPILSVETRRATGFEALARWPNPRRGLVAPAEFIPVLEETGGIRRLGDWAVHAACQQLAAWTEEWNGAVGLSVNLSPQQLTHEGFADEVRRAIGRYDVDPALLWFEITETLLMQDLDLAVKALSTLRDIGCRLALDDFGTGWSSLTYLRSVPVDLVKIDRSFIHGVADSPDDRAIVGSVIWLCRTLEKMVVAEGVETEAQLEALAELGCTHAQGYHIARPQPAAEASAWLRANPPT
ncbi:MAG TPA: EAL domain-containing protein, partial [Acidimicrobiales bacterium]|nr:EAL domain-containing protein [Acidimicrobiales bacterium]